MWICTLNFSPSPILSQSHSCYQSYSLVLFQCINCSKQQQLSTETISTSSPIHPLSLPYETQSTNLATNSIIITSKAHRARLQSILTPSFSSNILTSHSFFLSLSPSLSLPKNSSIHPCNTPLTTLLYTPLFLFPATSTATSSQSTCLITLSAARFNSCHDMASSSSSFPEADDGE